MTKTHIRKNVSPRVSTICFLFCLFNIVGLAASEDDQLVFVNLIWRHGARSPVRTYPTNPYNNQRVWPQGFGQLTQLGMQQHYKLGQYFRERYHSFLNVSFYNRSQIYIRSTDFDRTLMSAESNMAGLFPPEGKQKWNGTNTSWQPVPIHTVPKPQEEVLRFPVTKCNLKYNQLLKDVFASKEYKAVDVKYQGFYKQIAADVQWKGELNLNNLWIISDPIICEDAANLTLPTWVSESVLKTFREIVGIEMSVKFGGLPVHYRIPMARINGGLLVKQIIDNIKLNINGSSNYKVVAYSAHDTTLSALLVALACFNNLPPPFASTVIIEMYNSTSGYYIKAFYRNSTIEPFPLDFLGCGHICPVSKFIQLTRNIIVDDLDKECSLDSTFINFHISSGDDIALCCLLVITWIIFGIILFKLRRNNSSFYESLPLNDKHNVDFIK
nr:prostatic acid phosphatase [Ciona intestinalis]|eukprot:XP_002131109.1 prostatic acid phosphatase [Ciona intestinalis]